ncbi:hypothetical protein HBI73_059260 [Parastagonospora nodorum]|nr:hypothetical protein HBH51_062390 [Parastagonospora nodorum]KAH3999045.1 hypothetical protein HBI10_119030 [Parastagonospora nodorum]KAH4025160.1 hypothetical protein HBI13_078160 [Parastagonospora nodorum]KAH4122760.1 hypothetical protein HBH47_081590 [Parastagonospora nodorum]KAH4603654.1 hypothetical protein HBH82_146500 [Parastagonospora nodorum]
MPNLEHWKTEVARFRVEIAKLRSEFLFDPLGGDVVAVFGLDGSLLANGAADGINVNLVGPLQPTSSSAQDSAPPGAVAGVKKKVEVVDLTEDYPL